MAELTPEQRRSARKKVLTASLLTGIAAITYTTITPLLPDLAEVLRIDGSAIGWVQGSLAVPGVIVAAFAGRLTDRLGIRPVGSVSLLIIGVGSVLSWSTRSFGPLIGARVLTGIGTAGCIVTGLSILGGTQDRAERQRAVSINAASATFASMAGPVVGGTLGTSDPFRGYLIGLSAAGVLPLLLGWSSAPHPSPSVPLEPDAASAGGSPFRRPSGMDVLGLLTATVVFSVCFAGFGSILVPILLEERFDSGPVLRGLIVSGATGANVAAAILIGRRGEQATRGTTFTFGFTVVGFGLLMAGTGVSPLFVAIALALAGFGIGTLYTWAQYHSTSLGTDRQRGAVLGAWASSVRLGQVIGPVLATAMAAWLGTDTALFIGGATALTLAAVWRRIRAYGGQATGAGAPTNPAGPRRPRTGEDDAVGDPL